MVVIERLTDPICEVSMTLKFVNAHHLDDEELVIDFSDGTTATYTADELAALRPVRERWDVAEEE